MVSKAYGWIATGGGAWSLASNWDDFTDGIDPSLAVPGPADSVTIAGASGQAASSITGIGAALAASFTNNVALNGEFAFGTLSLGNDGNGGLLAIGAGAVVQAGTALIGSGSLLASGSAAAFTVTAGMTLGAGQSGYGAAACNLDATNGGRIQLANLFLNASSASLYVDPASLIEIGTLGTAAPGALTIDPGATLIGQGSANAYGNVVDNGTITASGGDLLLGDVTGTGTLNIAADAVLVLNGATGPGQTVDFAGQQATLALATEFDQPQGAVTGFTTGDSIDMLGDPISAATYAATGQTTGVLTLFYGSQIADTLTLLGTYSGDVFLTAPDGAGGTLITVSPQTGGNGTPSAGTTTPDQYLWVGPGSSNWKLAANWEDVTTGADPARIAPGVNNLVTINCAASGSYTVIAGPANAASLSITGDVAMAGDYAIGTLTMGVGGDNMVGGSFELLPGTIMTAASLAIQDGAVTASGGATLSVAGTIALGGGESGIGLPITFLSATAGGTITCAALTMGGGSGNSVTTDPTGVLEIGTAGGARAGAVTIDAGATLFGNGEVNPFGALLDQGTITADGGTLVLGSVTGTGSLTLDDGATLTLEASTALPVFFNGANATLAIADELISLNGTISGFAPGDAIDIENDPITAVTGRLNGSVTILTFYYGSTSVGTVTLGSLYGGDKFIVVPDGADGTDVLVQKGNGGGGGGGQGTTDLLSWANPVSGAWNKAGNWFDITTNAAATAAPGTLNPVQITGPTGDQFQTIGGPAVCASVSMFGNTALSGAFTTGTLTIGGLPAGSTTLTEGILDILATTSVQVTGDTLITDGAIIVSTAATLTIAGTLTEGGGAPDGSGPAALLSAQGGGLVQIDALSMGGGSGDTLETDATSSIEIGTLGGALAGAVTLDAGISAAANGDINQDGLVIINGTLTAQGGTLIVGDSSGTGMLDIGAAATLELAGTVSCPIAMVGAGATLLLQGSSETPAGIVEDFSPGDLIVTGSSQIGSVAYAPGAGSVGTLTLYSGNQIAGAILLAGDFSGDTFLVQPDGEGSAISVQTGNGPPGGTTTPDQYAWIGGSAGNWNQAANWQDLSAGQDPALVAPGVNDLVTIQGGTATATTITGPANAATLTLLADVALQGQFAVGVLDIGHGSTTGLFALGAQTALQASQVAVDGGIVAQGGGLLCTGTLTLASGVLAASDQASLQAASLILAGQGDAISVDATSRLEIGDADDSQAGDITVDPGAVLQGAGVLNAQGQIVDQGTITALVTGPRSVLALGDVTGSGTLLIAVGATMVLQGSADSSLLIDFAGPGTLTVAGPIPQATIGGFGDGDMIDIPISGITGATYAETAPNLGILTLDAGNQAVAELTLVGVGIGQGFSVTGAAGGTIITTETTDYGGGGSIMRGQQDSSGSGQPGIISGFGFWQDLPTYVQEQLATFQENVGGTSYVYTSPDGSYFGPYQPGYANFAVISDPPDSIAGNTVALPPGYDALLVQGNVPLRVNDGGSNHDLLMGNAADDTITGFGQGDTLVGGTGGNSIIWAQGADTIYGGGNDSIITNLGPCVVTTAANSASVVFAGPSSNTITDQGNDTVVAVAGPGANDTVTAIGGDTVFAPSTGQITFHGGNAPGVVVGTGGTIEMLGGAGNGSSLWCANSSFVQFIGGAGSMAIIGGTGELDVQGGAGALSVFGGTGNTIIVGAAGPSRFLVGDGASTVSAASGNLVWLVGSANDSLVASGGNETIWGANSFGNNVFQAGSGPCIMSGGMGNDTFLGGSGSALLFGGGGANIYSFTNGLAGGAVTITDFNTSLDQIDLHGYSGATESQVGNNEVIALSDGTKITLDNVDSVGSWLHQG
jgi:hypothetical protein